MTAPTREEMNYDTLIKYLDTGTASKGMQLLAADAIRALRALRAAVTEAGMRVVG